MRNPKIRRLIEEKYEQMMESSLQVYAEALNATKRKAFLNKNGNVVYSDPEPFWKVKLEAADRALRHLEQSPAQEEAHAEADVQPKNQDDTELQKKVDSLSSADRALIVRTCEVDQRLAEVEQQLSEGSNGSERPK